MIRRPQASMDLIRARGILMTAKRSLADVVFALEASKGFKYSDIVTL